MKDFRIKTCTVGEIGTNCYLVYREKKAVIVDPGDNAPYILNRCKELGLIPEAVLLTHGHFDHIMAVEEICRAFRGLKLYAGEMETEFLKDSQSNLSTGYGRSQILIPDVLFKDQEEVKLAGMTWKVLFTPGHTPGSVCYWIKEAGVLLSGDTLFAESFGRTDLPGGSFAAITDSIVNKLFLLPDDTIVYPGHGDPTTVGHEKQYNPAAYER